MVARFCAYLADLAIRFVVVSICWLLLVFLGRLGMGLGFVLFFLLEWLYPVVFELSPGAATPGKRMVGLSVVMDTGLPITPAASLTRNLLRAADFLPSLYAFAALSMLLRHDFKRLGDLAAGTLVVYATTSGVRSASPAPAPPAAFRSPRAQAAIIAWAGRVTRLTEARADELAEIAVPAVAPRAMRGDRIRALAGVAHWLLGRR